jgi:competence protein ComEA
VLVWGIYDHQRHTFEIDAPLPARTDAHRTLDETLDPNQAAWYELARLPDIGEVLAKRIVAHRNELGIDRPFNTADDLQAVRGIGPKTAEKLRPYLRFDAQSEGVRDER